MLTSYWGQFLLQLRLSTIFHAAPFKWDPIQRILKPIEIKMKVKLNYSASIMIYTFLLFTFLGQYEIIRNRRLAECVISIGFTFVFVLCGFARLLHFHSSSENVKSIVAAYNSMLLFERKFIVGDDLVPQQSMKAFLKLSSISATTAPALVAVLQFLDPSASPLLELWKNCNIFNRTISHNNLRVVSTLFESHNNKLNHNWVFRVVSMLITMIVGQTAISTATLVIAFGVSFKLIAFYSYTKRMIEIPNLLNSKWTILIVIKNKLKMFKVILLMVHSFNESYQWIFFTALMPILEIVLVISLCGFIKFHKEITFLGNIYVAVVVVNAVLCLGVIYTIAGQVYFNSCDLLKEWKRKSFTVSGSESKILRKSIAACKGFKIRIGSVNFVDRLTPFKVIGLCMTLTVKLLAAFTLK